VINLAAIRYRSVLALHGGPIEFIEEGDLKVFGKRYFQANAQLKASLVPRRGREVYGDADGTGMHPSPMVARYIAISEALERWAYYDTAQSSNRTEFGFHVDGSSNGMAAFPGLSDQPARRAARLEAIERFCLLNWWEHRMDGEVRPTELPGVNAVTFRTRFGETAVIVYMRSELGFFVYGHAAAESFEKACEHALLELFRHESAIKEWRKQRNPSPPKNPYERRALFFSTDEGYSVFDRRLRTKTQIAEPEIEVVCDNEIRGPWSAYTTVWRVLFRPPSQKFVDNDERYFFW
jgi:hypothetical protein